LLEEQVVAVMQVEVVLEVIEHLLTEKHLAVEHQAKVVLPWVQEVTPAQLEQVVLVEVAQVL
jgi:hypothetical protein